MRKWLIMGLLCTLPLLSLRMAAAMPEQSPGDVPAGHWSLKIVLQLMDHGVIESDERAFIERCQTGAETISRKEVAVLVESAEAKAQSTEDKQLVERLKKEFAAELGALQSRAKSNPFDDVPQSDWTYKAVVKLAQEGIIEKVLDDRPLTRYEMAQMVAKAMAKNPTGEQKRVVDRLAKEYAHELNALGVTKRAPVVEEPSEHAFNLDTSAKSNIRAELKINHWIQTGEAEVGPEYELEYRLNPSRNVSSKLKYLLTRDASAQNSETYKPVKEQAFQTVLDAPLSSFGADVDTGAYSNVRRYIQSGAKPPTDAVRTEEMLNYFDYDYSAPRDEEPLAMTLETAVCPWQPKHQLVMLGMKGKEIPAEQLPPSNLVFLIDVSGSMDEPDKLPLLKKSYRELVSHLRPQDKVSIVVYAGAAGVVLEPTSGAYQTKIMNAIDRLEAGGSTAGGEGLKLAYQLAEKNSGKHTNSRVILATDGDFNVGVSDEAGLTKLIEKERKSGVYLSVLGFGMGNIKDDKMEALADNGNGHYAYIDSFMEAKKVFGKELAGTLYAIAKDVKLQVEFNPALVKSYRLLGYEKRAMTAEEFKDDAKDSGEIGVGHTVTALYEIELQDAAEPAQSQLVFQQVQFPNHEDLLEVRLRYKHPKQEQSNLRTFRLKSAQTPYMQASEGFRFAAAVAEYAMLLKDSELRGDASYEQTLRLAQSAKGIDAEGYRAEFIQLVKATKSLK